jgi:hypothetical protein
MCVRALPLSVFQGFLAEFIPVVGTYVEAAVPALMVLGTLGVWRAAPWPARWTVWSPS